MNFICTGYINVTFYLQKLFMQHIQLYIIPYTTAVQWLLSESFFNMYSYLQLRNKRYTFQRSNTVLTKQPEMEISVAEKVALTKHWPFHPNSNHGMCTMNTPHFINTVLSMLFRRPLFVACRFVVGIFCHLPFCCESTRMTDEQTKKCRQRLQMKSVQTVHNVHANIFK